MANVPGATNVTPGVFTNVETQSTGASVPGGILVPCIMGEGAKNEIIVASAVGGGADGFNPTFTSTTGAEGRYFELSQAPIVSNRTQLFKNGVLLVGLEGTISSSAFSDSYDYLLDITLGHIELQTAHLVNQGGSFYFAGPTNVGDGYIGNLSLVDINAPQETWTIKCVGAQFSNLNVPIAGTENFVAFGSVSGNILNANGSPFTWLANNQVVSNGILSFSIGDGIVTFNPGDYFTVQVYSGVLNANDSLTATYIPVGNINDPTYFQTMSDLTGKHGPVSLTNRLSLGGQLAFANDTPGVLAM